MAIALPNTLTAGTTENINHVQANFDALANAFPLAANSTNFSQVPQVRVYHNTTQTAATGVTQALVFNSERYDLGTPSTNMHDTSSDTGRLTCRVAGLYSVGFHAYFACPAAMYDVTEIRLNGSTVIARRSQFHTTSENAATGLWTQYRLAVNDYIEVTLLQNSGSTLTIDSAAQYSPEFFAHWVSP